MDVVLVRHAIAEERDARRWSDDAQRPLTDFGRERFAPAARGLGRLVGPAEHVLASPYARAWETAEILSAEASWPSPATCAALAAHATTDAAVEAITALAGDGTVICVGHEPNLTLLAQALLRSKDAGEVPWFKKGGALCVRFRGPVEPGRGKLHWARAPRELRKLRD